jgi:GDPmannose 4,6-dehydratase
MSQVLVLGVSGQDGSYLAELLLDKGNDVVGVTRDAARAVAALPVTVRDRVAFEEWNMQDPVRIVELFARYRPAEAYNCAARSTGSGMHDDPVGIAETNGVAVAQVLEAIRSVSAGTRFCQASSSEMFGEPAESPQSETTPFKPRSPYGAAKLYAHAMIEVYRRAHRLYACSAILFNHESPRRPLHYVTRKVSHAAAAIKLGLTDALDLGNLAARRDWGFAGDYVRAMWAMLQRPQPDDYVVATGVTHSVRDLCEVAFAHVGLDYRRYVRSDPASYRPDERGQLVGDARKARAELAWQPRVDFEAMIRAMVDADLEQLRATSRTP